MDRAILDTDTLIDYSRGFAPWIDVVMKTGNVQLVIPTIVIAEFFASNTLDEPHQEEVADKTFALFNQQDLTEPIAKTLGALLRHKTYPTGASTADLIIAATSIALHAPLATRNTAHFKGIPGLTFFQPEDFR